ncbi:MAG: hypothetical protein PHE68_00960 [Candidatus Peribacteraceae bacterium]|nr:hypothetical protein [Candidatus Peribacteraceae bacterium]MDD5074909.1 hypothetical protein [Candidatus Peribacteraceae bacterium]
MTSSPELTQSTPLGEAENSFVQLKHQLRTGWDKVEMRTLFSLEEAIVCCLLVQKPTNEELQRLATLYHASQKAWMAIFGTVRPYEDIEKHLTRSLAPVKDAEFERLCCKADSLIGDLKACARILFRNLLQSILRR